MTKGRLSFPLPEPVEHEVSERQMTRAAAVWLSQCAFFLGLCTLGLWHTLGYEDVREICRCGIPMGWPVHWKPNPCCGAFSFTGFLIDTVPPVLIAAAIAYGIPWLVRKARQAMT